jgi:hypothetical protein
MNRLDDLITQLQNKTSYFETGNIEVSNGTVGWHIEHSLLTLNRITHSLIESNPKDYKWKFNFTRIVILSLKKIPRGNAKSPEVVQPKSILDKTYLDIHLSKIRNNIKKLEDLSRNKYFEHPVFGKLRLQHAIHFLEIHTNHHLKIIEDIIKKKKLK